MLQIEQKNYHSTLILSSSVGASWPQFWKFCPVDANNGGTSSSPSILHNSTVSQIRALDQPLHCPVKFKKNP